MRIKKLKRCVIINHFFVLDWDSYYTKKRTKTNKHSSKAASIGPVVAGPLQLHSYNILIRRERERQIANIRSVVKHEKRETFCRYICSINCVISCKSLFPCPSFTGWCSRHIYRRRNKNIRSHSLTTHSKCPCNNFVYVGTTISPILYQFVRHYYTMAHWWMSHWRPRDVNCRRIKLSYQRVVHTFRWVFLGLFSNIFE